MTLTSGLGAGHDQARQTNSLAGLALTLFLVVVALYLVDVLRRYGAYQDCVLAGRVACDS